MARHIVRIKALLLAAVLMLPMAVVAQGYEVSGESSLTGTFTLTIFDGDSTSHSYSEKSNKGLYVIIVILLLLLLCFVGYFLLNQPKGGQTTEPETADSTLVEAPADNETAAQQSAKTDKPATAKPAGREIIVNGEGVRMRFGPSLKAGYLKTPQGGTLSVNKGTHLPCVGEEGDWYKVVYQGKQYYMSKQFCLPAK